MRATATALIAMMAAVVPAQAPQSQPATRPVVDPIVDIDERYARELREIAGELESAGDAEHARRLRTIANGLLRRAAQPPHNQQHSPLLGIVGGNRRMETNYNPPGANIVGTTAAATSVVAPFRADLMRIRQLEINIERSRQQLDQTEKSSDIYQVRSRQLAASEEELTGLKSALAAKVRGQAPDIVKDIELMMPSASPEHVRHIQTIREFFSQLPEDDAVLVEKIQNIAAQADMRLMNKPAMVPTTVR